MMLNYIVLTSVTFYPLKFLFQFKDVLILSWNIFKKYSKAIVFITWVLFQRVHKPILCDLHSRNDNDFQYFFCYNFILLQTNGCEHGLQIFYTVYKSVIDILYYLYINVSRNYHRSNIYIYIIIWIWHLKKYSHTIRNKLFPKNRL